jgi:hypothetical protein
LLEGVKHTFQREFGGDLAESPPRTVSMQHGDMAQNCQKIGQLQQIESLFAAVCTHNG